MYRNIIAHVVMGRDAIGRPKVQVRPLPGQGFDPSLNIECARKLRAYPLGTKIRLRVKLTDMQGALFLYSYFGWPTEIVPSNP